MPLQDTDLFRVERAGIKYQMPASQITDYIGTTNGYTIFPIWAEEGGGLTNNNRQWSFGNGATGAINIVLPVDCELFAVSFDCETAASQVSMDVMIDDALGFTTKVFAAKDFELRPTPLSLTAGQYVGFRTNTEVVAGTDARVCAWFRIKATPVSTSVINDLLDVSIGSITSGQLLQFNGSNIVPFTLPDQLDRALTTTVLDNTTNINQGTTYAPIPVFGTSLAVNDNGSFTVDNTQEITINFDGWIEVNSNINYTSGGQRVALQSVFTLDSTTVGFQASGGYIRATSGHNEASLHHSGVYIPVTNGSVLRYAIRRESTLTTATTMIPGVSGITIRRVKT